MTNRELRAIRRQLDLTQPQMAKAIGIGLRSLQAYELGEKEVPVVVGLAAEQIAAKEGNMP